MGNMLNDYKLSTESFVKKIIYKKTKLYEITPNMIEDGVLTIPEGIIDINTNLNALLAEAHISSNKIKVVVFPKSLQTIDNFFYENKDVQLVIFNNPVALTSKHNQGTFESSNVKEIIIPHGFTSVDYKLFSGTVLGKLVMYGEVPTVCTSFFNSSVEYLTTVLEKCQATGITKVERSYVSDGTNIGWQEVTMLMHRMWNLKIKTIPINQDYVLMQDFETLKEKAISEYVTVKTRTLEKGVSYETKSSMLEHEIPVNLGFATN